MLKLNYKIFVCILSICSFSVFAQHKNIRINLGFQYNLPQRYFNRDIDRFNDKGSGIGLHFSPQYLYNKHLSFEATFQYDLTSEGYITDAIKAYNMISLTPTVKYYFTRYRIKPFVGIGLGVDKIYYRDLTVNLGIRPMIGLNVNHFLDISLEFNRILPNALPIINNYYVGVKCSFSIGASKTKDWE